MMKDPRCEDGTHYGCACDGQEEVKPQPVVEFIDDKSGFQWRLRLGEELSKWYRAYDGVLIHTFGDGRTFFIAASDYYHPELPALLPVELTIPKRKSPQEISRDENC